MNVDLHPWIAVGTLLAVFVGLYRRRSVPPDLLFMGALVIVTITGVISVEDALAGFANPAPLTVAALFVVTTGLRTTGVLDWVGHRVLGTARTGATALKRLTPMVLVSSAIVNTTPIVAMLVPVTVDWCRQRQASPSKLLIPLSYLAILGGTCTLIGTSTTLVVNGLMIDAGLPSMSFFEIGQVGLPCALVGAFYIVFVLQRRLPNRTELIEKLGEQRREYLVEMLVQPECRLVGQTVEQAGLRHLPGLFLIEIDRAAETITPVAPDDVIGANDRLIFTGVVSTIVDLEKIPGLIPATDLTYEFHPRQRIRRSLTEAVISRSSPLIGRTVRGVNFRQLYNAAVVAVHRNGERLTNKVGDIRLQAGDTLLLQTRSEFLQNFRHSRDFYLVSNVEGQQPRRHDRAWLAATLLLVLVVWLSAGSLIPDGHFLAGLKSTAVAAIAVAGLLIAFRCMSVDEARGSIDMQVILTIIGALGLAKALDKSGAAAAVAGFLVQHVQDVMGTHHSLLRPALLLVMYLLAMGATALLTSNAIAAMLFPLAVQVAYAAGLSPRPFVMAITVAAILSFINPAGYATNLIVMGPGGYRPADYRKAGLPLAALLAVTALVLIPLIWPF